MPQFYCWSMPPEFRGFWGTIRFYLNPPPPRPDRAEGSQQLPITIHRNYPTITPAGFACSFRVTVEVYWAGALAQTIAFI